MMQWAISMKFPRRSFVDAKIPARLFAPRGRSPAARASQCGRARVERRRSLAEVSLARTSRERRVPVARSSFHPRVQGAG
eukprot:31160-Pelagococcus_subviridis.AAC.7